MKLVCKSSKKKTLTVGKIYDVKIRRFSNNIGFSNKLLIIDDRGRETTEAIYRFTTIEMYRNNKLTMIGI